MKLLDVEVRDYRKLGGPVKVDFTDGLNVVWGDNELGKSTLLDAIWDGLTLRSKIGGEARRRRQPFEGGSPMVSLRFSHDGSTYQLHKNFKGQGGLTRLSVDGGAVLLGAEAETEVLRILGVVGAKRGDRLEREGIWPVVFVRQGKATQGPTDGLDATASGTLTQRLGDIAGEIFAGDGAETTLLSAGKERARYWTAKTGAATGELAQERALLKAAAAEHETLAEQLRVYQADLDKHATWLSRRRCADDERPALDAALAEADAAFAALKALRGRIEQAQGRLAVATAETGRARDRKLRRLELQMALGRNADTAAKLKRKLVIDETVLKRRDREKQRLVDAVKAATERWEDAKAAQQAARRRVQRHDVQVRLQQLDDQWAAIERARQARDDARDAVAANPMTDAKLRELRRLRRTSDEAAARLGAAAAHVSIEALVALDATVGDDSFRLGGGATHDVMVLQPTSIQLGETARLQIRPGGEELQQRRKEARAAADALASALDAIGCADLAAAEAKGDARRKATATQQAQQSTLKAMGAARIERARIDAREQLAKLTDEQDDDASDNDAAAWRELAARRQDDTAARAVERDAAQEALNQHELMSAGLRGAAEQRKTTMDGHIRREEAAGAAHAEHLAKHGDDDALNAAALAAENSALKGAAEVTELQRELGGLDADAIETAATRARAAVASNQQEHAKACTEIAVLESRLNDAAALDLHDLLDKAAAELDRATKRAARVERRAAAAKLLYTTLSSCRTQAQERHRQPLNDALNELVGELFPGATLKLLGDNYDSPVLDRGPEGVFTFEQLSTGTREQIGLLVRIALARLLNKGTAMPLLLDDALVHTDPDRLRRIAAVLNIAARDLQVIYVTCDWTKLEALLPTAHAIDFRGAIELQGAVGTPSQPPKPRQESPAYP